VSKRVLRRRELLKLSAAAGGAALLAACTPPSAGPSASPGATTGPTTAGKYPLGKLEGPVIVTDAAKFPKTFKEAPELAALVQQGKLAPVAQRIGQDPLVIQPVHGIGKYGGTLNKAIVGGLNDLSTTRFFTGPPGLLIWDYEWKTIKPNIARSFTVSPDNRTLTVQLRRGMKWSDGAPFTADDIIFWFDDILNNEEVHPGLSADISIGGKQITAEKIDDTTVRFVAPEPFPMLVDVVATPSTDMGHTFRHQLGRGGPYAPKHYISKFHAKYAGKEAADRLAAEAKQTSWAANVKAKLDVRQNTDLPVIFPWIVKTPASDPTTFVIERNPYSIWVDTDGNQLPYIGTVRHATVQSTDLLALKTTSGELDFMELQYTVAQLPILIESQTKGNYKVYLDPGQAGNGIAVNLAYEEDPVVGELLRNVDFRRALSMAIDRDPLNETFFLGTGTPSSTAPASENKYYPGDEWRTKWAKLDLAQANQLLDKVGLTQKDAAGYRLRKDGKRLALSFMAFDEIIDQAQFAEMVKTHWQKIGVDLVIDKVSLALATERTNANTAQLTFSNVVTDEPNFNNGFQIPGAGPTGQIMGVPYRQWLNSGGRQGKEPSAEIKQAWDLYGKMRAAATAEERIQLGKDLTKLAIDQVFAIGIVVGDLTNGIRIAKNTLGNVPARFPTTHVLRSPLTSMAQTYYFK
jgi:peptide/nickel transport system substrate-binding protein